MIRKIKPDVVHFPAFPPGVLVRHKKIIFTLHDATMWKYKSTLSLKNKLYMRPLSELALKKSKYVFTVSQNSFENIVDVFPYLKSKLFVTGESISEKFKIIDDDAVIENIKRKYNTGEKFLLSVCSLEPRKNIPRLLMAYSQLLKEEKYKNVKLVLVGRRAWGNNIIEDTINELKLEENVVITDYVSDDDLLAIYNAAYCFVYPTLYEGFGLPVLEAMACGIPVISSNNSSIPEVAGDSAILINAESIDEICSSMEQVLDDSELRNQLINKGKNQLTKFLWEDIIKKFIMFYTGD